VSFNCDQLSERMGNMAFSKGFLNLLIVQISWVQIWDNLSHYLHIRFY